MLGGLFSMSDVEPNHYVWFVTHCSQEELGVINKRRASHITKTLELVFILKDLKHRSAN